MKFSQGIEIEPYQIETFLLFVPHFTKKQIEEFVEEYSHYPDVSNNDYLLMNATLKNPALTFIWDELKYHHTLLTIMNRFEAYLRKGHHLGLGDYLPFPEHVKSTQILESELASKKSDVENFCKEITKIIKNSAPHRSDEWK